MQILKRLDAAWQAATALPPFPMPKAPGKPLSLPGYRTSKTVSASAVRRPDRLLATTDRLSARDLNDTRKTIRALAKGTPDLSSAASFMLRVGIPEQYTVVARNMDGLVDAEATKTAHALLRRMTFLGNPDGSFGNNKGLQSLSEELSLELFLDGAACLEVALDKQRVPASFNPISVTTLEMFEEDNSFKLKQKVGGDLIDLDYLNIIYVSVDQLQTELYPSSYTEAAIQPVLADIDFNNDLRRALKRSILPRLTAIIDSEAVKKLTPPDILMDPDKFAAYKNELIAEVETAVNEAGPEDAFVGYDSVTYKNMESGQAPGELVERIQKVLNGKIVAGAKTLPTILGHGGTSNAASAETMLYVKQANMIRVKLNELYSRALTVAIRILGIDGYVEFKYADIDLRPTSELEAYFSMRQSRILDLLSLGMIDDTEACIMLTGNLPPNGYVPKAGTMFRAGTNVIQNPSSNTSAMSQTLTPKTPDQPKTQQ